MDMEQHTIARDTGLHFHYKTGHAPAPMPNDYPEQSKSNKISQKPERIHPSTTTTELFAKITINMSTVAELEAQVARSEAKITEYKEKIEDAEELYWEEKADESPDEGLVAELEMEIQDIKMVMAAERRNCENIRDRLQQAKERETKK